MECAILNVISIALNQGSGLNTSGSVVLRLTISKVPNRASLINTQLKNKNKHFSHFIQTLVYINH